MDTKLLTISSRLNTTFSNYLVSTSTFSRRQHLVKHASFMLNTIRRLRTSTIAKTSSKNTIHVTSLKLQVPFSMTFCSFSSPFQSNWRLLSTSTGYTSSTKAKSFDFKSSNGQTINAHGTNFVTVDKTRHLMRLIYARVHPDLFTNFNQAQKQNENSLKTLRNLLDSYASQFNSGPTSLAQNKFLSDQSELTFYVKDSTKDSNLRKLSIKLASSQSSASPYAFSSLNYGLKIEKHVENVMNQFIDLLSLPVDKFDSAGLAESDSSKTSYNYKMTYRRVDLDHSFDEDYIDGDDFERWTNENIEKNRMPKLIDWYKSNSKLIDSKRKEADKMLEEINKTKNFIIKQWSLRDIIIDTNWSLKHFNAYLTALKSTSMVEETSKHFKGFTLVLTNHNRPGLRKNGHIHLSCGQVFEEWLNALAVATQNAELVNEISHMETLLSRLLKQIRICDTLDHRSMANLNVNESMMSLAAYYRDQLDKILGNLTQHLNESNESSESNASIHDLLDKADFSHLQVTIQENVNNIQLNKSGQFIIGASNRINYENTIDFIRKNASKAVQLHNEYVRSVDRIRQLTDQLELALNTNNKIQFDTGIEYNQKLDSLNHLLSENMKPVLDELASCKNLDLTIGTVFKVNDNGSINIPWNWFLRND